MVIKKLFSSINMRSTLNLGTYKLIKVVIAYENQKFIFRIFYIVLIDFTNINNSKKFIIIYFVSNFN